MKRFTLTLVAALIAVVSFAQSGLKQPVPVSSVLQAKPESQVRLRPVVKGLQTPAKPSMLKKASRKAAIEDLEIYQGDYISATFNFEYDAEAGELVNSAIDRNGYETAIEVTGTNTLTIRGLAGNPDMSVEATVDLETGKLTIPVGQIVDVSETYGNIKIENATSEGDITGTLYDGGVIEFDDIWYETIDYQDETYRWSEYFMTTLAPANGVMTYDDEDSAGEISSVTQNVLIIQDPDTKDVSVWNFHNFVSGAVIDFVVNHNKTFFAACDEQPVAYYDENTLIYYFGFDGQYIMDITGVCDGAIMTSDNGLAYIFNQGQGYRGWTYPEAKFSITLTDGTEFEYPELEIGDLVTPPINLETEDYPFTATIYDDESPRGRDHATTVKIGWVENDVYIQGLDKYHPEAWVKGTLNDDSEVVIPVTYMGMTEEITYWLAAYGGSDGPDSLVLDYDATSKTFEYPATVVVYNGSTAGAGYIYYLNGFFIGQKPLPTAAPEDLVTVDMPFKGNFYASVEEDEPEEVTGTVKVGFTEAGEVYIQNLFAADAKDGWIKGFFYEEDPSLVIFPLNQLVGISTSGFNLYLAGYYKDPEEEKGGASNVIFSYDAVNNFFETLNPMMLSRFKNSLNYECIYEAGLVIGDVPEAVEGVKAEVAGDNSWFNIGGQRVAQPTKKGLYIHNGKKVVVK